MTTIETGVRDVIARISKLDVSSLGREEDLVEHLGVDSLQGLQILAGIEKRFDVRLPDDELITMRTIGRISDAVARLDHEAHEEHEERSVVLQRAQKE